MLRPNRIGWALAAFFFCAGLAITIWDPTVFLGEMWMVGGVALGLVYVMMNRRADRAEELIREGIPGEAEILELRQTGSYVNGNPRVRLKLRVHANGVPPFETTHTFTVPMSAIGALTAGGTVPIYLDHRKTSRYTIDWFGVHRSGATPDERLENLARLRERGLITDEEFREQRARILNAL